MKKLLELLGTILITSNAAGPLVSNKPNNNNDKIKNSPETLIRPKRQAPRKSVNKKDNPTKSSTPKSQNEQSSTSTTDNQVEFIKKEITLNEDYADNIQNMLKDFMKNNQIDPLRMINNEGIVATDKFETLTKRKERDDNIKIIKKLDKILQLKAFDANKIRILILTLKNKDSNKIRLIINLDNFYLQGFINNQNQYFYFKEEKSLNEWKQEIKKLTEELNEWNKINEEIKLLDLKKINNNHHIINKIDKIKENLKKQWGGEKYKENKEKINLLNKNLFNKIEINNQDLENFSKLNELKEKVETLKKEKIYLGQDKEEVNVYQKIQQIRQNALNLLNKGKSEIKKQYKKNIENYQWNIIFNEITSIIQSNIITIQHKKIKENKINEEIIKKYSINTKKQHKLNYNGSYQNKGLNTVNQNIIISQDTLNNAIANLSDYDINKQSQDIKNDLVQMIFVTSEAMRFGSYLKYFNHYYKDKASPPKSSTPKPQNAQPSTSATDNQVEFENIPTNVQEILDGKINLLKWKDYEPQLIDGWKASSEFVEEQRKEIFEKLWVLLEYFEIHDDFLNNLKEEIKLNPESLFSATYKILNKIDEKDIPENIKNKIKNIWFANIFNVLKNSETMPIEIGDQMPKSVLDDMKGWTSVHVAIKTNNLDIAKLLIWRQNELIDFLQN